jgi:hypothetical protein
MNDDYAQHPLTPLQRSLVCGYCGSHKNVHGRDNACTISWNGGPLYGYSDFYEWRYDSINNVHWRVLAREYPNDFPTDRSTQQGDAPMAAKKPEEATQTVANVDEINRQLTEKIGELQKQLQENNAKLLTLDTVTRERDSVRIERDSFKREHERYVKLYNDQQEETRRAIVDRDRAQRRLNGIKTMVDGCAALAKASLE